MSQQEKLKFAIIGASGYIAPRHMKAIKDTENALVAALDPSDSVGVIDSYFPEANFFTEFERFDRHIDKLRRKGGEHKIDYVSICSPNYLHDAHARFSLRSDASAICEKPLVLNPWNLDGLQEIEESCNKNLFCILQLRLHPSLITLRKQLLDSPKSTKYEVDLTYITSRGKWYGSSWKGDESKSGGIATNIGVHFFDMLYWLFGNLQRTETHLYSRKKASGYLEFQKARVRWYLSIDSEDLPEPCKSAGQRTYRSITVDNEEVEFSGGFNDLHTISYQKILEGNGFKINDARPAIQIVHDIRSNKTTDSPSVLHEFAKRKL